MSIYEEIQDTLDSPGMKHIVNALRGAHKTGWRKLRTCTPEELPHIQAAMKAIDTTLPQIVERLMNSHLEANQKKEWWFLEWIKRIR